MSASVANARNIAKTFGARSRVFREQVTDRLGCWDTVLRFGTRADDRSCECTQH